MSGPIEGNTLVEIFGSDLGQQFSDIDSIMLHQQLCDRTGLEESYQVGSRWVMDFLKVTFSFL